MTATPQKRAVRLLALSLAALLASCSSCEVPKEPVLPADLTGHWVGAYTLYDAAARPLTDSLRIDLESVRGQVMGSGSRVRYLQDMEPIASEVEVQGSVVVNTFRIELIDPATRNRAVFDGKVEGDTLSGQLSVEGQAMGDLRMVGYRDSH